MLLDESVVLRAFSVYKQLTKDGYVEGPLFEEYRADSEVRRLIEAYVEEVDCVAIVAGDRLYLVPKTRHSEFHYSNETLKRTYLRANATNADLYMMYFAILVLFGKFYDSYTTRETTLNFVVLDDWVRSVTERVEFLKEHDLEALEQLEGEYSYNWLSIIERWDVLDDYKETAKRQSGQTQSRLSFIHTVSRFLEKQELIKFIGEDEITLTEKAKTIVQSYFMDYEHNRGILDFLYEHELAKEAEQ